MRCILLYITIVIKKFIVEAHKQQDVAQEVVFKYIIRHFKMLMTGVDMLKDFDIHIAQIVAQLHSIEKVAKPFFEKYGLLDDFLAVKQYCMAKSKYHRVEGVAADKIGVLSEKA